MEHWCAPDNTVLTDLSLPASGERAYAAAGLVVRTDVRRRRSGASGSCHRVGREGRIFSTSQKTSTPMQHSDDVTPADPRRRQLMVAGMVAAAATSLPLLVTTAHAAAARHHPT